MESYCDLEVNEASPMGMVLQMVEGLIKRKLPKSWGLRVEEGKI